MIKATGIVRRVDELGRVVIPVELRRNLGIEERDGLEIYLEGEAIVLQKFEPACIFCGSTEDVREFRGRVVCWKCVKAMGEAAGGK